MSFGLGDSEWRHRRRPVARIIRLVLVAACLGGAGLFGYQLGIERSKTVDARLRERLSEAEATIERLDQDRIRLLSDQQRAVNAVQAWKTRYEADVPREPVRTLAARVAERIADGVSPERIERAVRFMASERTCRDVETRIFFVNTPIYRGGQLIARFDDGIAIRAAGESERDEQGRPESWYDETKPVEIRVDVPDGPQHTVSEVLPVTHTVIHGGYEYSFTVSDGDRRGYAEVSGIRCTFP